MPKLPSNHPGLEKGVTLLQLLNTVHSGGGFVQF